jgi:flavin reductase (DIM6/NTAB) family NADH-FMN oxidoreductase RutF
MTPVSIAARNGNAVSASEFADAMSSLASGVVLVTSRVEDRPWGMTVTAFASVSADPPTVLVSLRSQSATARAIAANGAFGVSILSREQTEIAELGAAPGAPKYIDSLVEHRERSSSSPAVAHALAHLDCHVVRAVEEGDHTVFFGRVQTAGRRLGGAPLIYHARSYRSFLAPEPTERNLRCVLS